MTKLKGAAILGVLAIAGVTLVTSLPASGGESFLLVSTKRLAKACRAVEDVDSGICKVAAGLVERLGDLDLMDDIPPAQLERALRKMRPFVKRGLKQECCDAPCRSECSGGGRACFTDDQCPGGETCIPCPAQPCQTLCEAYKGNRCDGCLTMVSNLESWLAINGSVRLLGDVMESACDGRFADPNITLQCKGEIQQSVAEVVDRVLANAPPLTACQNPALRACPTP